MKIVKKVSAPVRIDFAGGTTDIEPFPSKYGGAVLNAAIDKYVFGELVASDKQVGLKYHVNVPTSSGLGTSGVMNLVWLSLISNIEDKKKLAEQVYKLEQSQGLIGGKQDQYASAFGGINLLEFGRKGSVKVNRLRLKKKTIRQLEKNLILVYTGKPHFSGDANKAMINNLKKGKNLESMQNLKKIAYDMKKTLLKGDLKKFANLMNQETFERSKLHKKILSKETKKIIRKGINSGALAAKICGSGNGGTILFFGDKKKLKKKFRKKAITFRFDWKGVRFL